jgi:hypothetical protein
MNRLPATNIAARLNAFAAAAIVTMTLLSGIGGLAAAENAAPRLAQAPAGQAA